MPKKIEVTPGDDADAPEPKLADMVAQWGSSLGLDAKVVSVDEGIATITVKAPHGTSKHRLETGSGLDDVIAGLDLIRTNELMV